MQHQQQHGASSTAPPLNYDFGELLIFSESSSTLVFPWRGAHRFSRFPPPPARWPKQTPHATTTMSTTYNTMTTGTTTNSASQYSSSQNHHSQHQNMYNNNQASPQPSNSNNNTKSSSSTADPSFSFTTEDVHWTIVSENAIYMNSHCVTGGAGVVATPSSAAVFPSTTSPSLSPAVPPHHHHANSSSNNFYLSGNNNNNNTSGNNSRSVSPSPASVSYSNKQQHTGQTSNVGLFPSVVDNNHHHHNHVSSYGSPSSFLQNANNNNNNNGPLSIFYTNSANPRSAAAALEADCNSGSNKHLISSSFLAQQAGSANQNPGSVSSLMTGAHASLTDKTLFILSVGVPHHRIDVGIALWFSNSSLGVKSGSLTSLVPYLMEFLQYALQDLGLTTSKYNGYSCNNNTGTSPQHYHQPPNSSFLTTPQTTSRKNQQQGVPYSSSSSSRVLQQQQQQQGGGNFPPITCKTVSNNVMISPNAGEIYMTARANLQERIRQVSTLMIQRKIASLSLAEQQQRNISASSKQQQQKQQQQQQTLAPPRRKGQSPPPPTSSSPTTSKNDNNILSSMISHHQQLLAGFYGQCYPVTNPRAITRSARDVLLNNKDEGIKHSWEATKALLHLVQDVQDGGLNFGCSVIGYALAMSRSSPIQRHNHQSFQNQMQEFQVAKFEREEMLLLSMEANNKNNNIIDKNQNNNNTNHDDIMNGEPQHLSASANGSFSSISSGMLLNNNRNRRHGVGMGVGGGGNSTSISTGGLGTPTMRHHSDTFAPNHVETNLMNNTNSNMTTGTASPFSPGSRQEPAADGKQQNLKGLSELLSEALNFDLQHSSLSSSSSSPSSLVDVNALLEAVQFFREHSGLARIIILSKRTTSSEDYNATCLFNVLRAVFRPGGSSAHSPKDPHSGVFARKISDKDAVKNGMLWGDAGWWAPLTHIEFSPSFSTAPNVSSPSIVQEESAFFRPKLLSALEFDHTCLIVDCMQKLIFLAAPSSGASPAAKVMSTTVDDKNNFCSHPYVLSALSSIPTFVEEVRTMCLAQQQQQQQQNCSSIPYSLHSSTIHQSSFVQQQHPHPFTQTLMSGYGGASRGANNNNSFNKQQQNNNNKMQQQNSAMLASTGLRPGSADILRAIVDMAPAFRSMAATECTNLFLSQNILGQSDLAKKLDQINNSIEEAAMKKKEGDNDEDDDNNSSSSRPKQTNDYLTDSPGKNNNNNRRSKMMKQGLGIGLMKDDNNDKNNELEITKEDEEEFFSRNNNSRNTTSANSLRLLKALTAYKLKKLAREFDSSTLDYNTAAAAAAVASAGNNQEQQRSKSASKRSVSPGVGVPTNRNTIMNQQVQYTSAQSFDERSNTNRRPVSSNARGTGGRKEMMKANNNQNQRQDDTTTTTRLEPGVFTTSFTSNDVMYALMI